METQKHSGFLSEAHLRLSAVVMTAVLFATCFIVSCLAADALPPVEEATTAPVETASVPAEETTVPADEPTSPFCAPDLSAPFSLKKDGGETVVYPVRIEVDANADGKTNTADVRAVLRHTSKIEPLRIAEELADLTEDGRLSSTDARLLLRYCARLDKYYRTESGAVASGLFMTKDGKPFSMNRYGAADQGLKEIDGTLYCFKDGAAMTGPVSVGGRDLYFGPDGKPASGDVTVRGEVLYVVGGEYFTGQRETDQGTFFYENGRLFTGDLDVGGTVYHYEKGSLFSGFLTVGNEELCYYQGLPANGSYAVNGVAVFYKNGKPFTGDELIDGRPVHYADGQIVSFFSDRGGATYYIVNGEVQYSWVQAGEDFYYLDRETGRLATNTKVDGIPVGPTGAAQKTNYNVEKIRTFMKARSILREITDPNDSVSQKKLKAFRWVCTFPYAAYRYLGETARSVEGWEMIYANDIYEWHSGCCVSASCAFAFLAVEAGCHKVYVADENDPLAGHAWTTMEGNNNVYDVVFAKSDGYEMNYDADVSDYRKYPGRKTYIGG